MTLSAGGCATVYLGEAQVPNTDQRLVVGHDSGPNKKIWVLVNGKSEKVTILRK